jgi:hypothetical protein
MRQIILFVLIILFIYFSFTQNKSTLEPFESYGPGYYGGVGGNLFMGGKSKCFSCEKDMLRRGLPAHLAQPTKCFSCVADMAKRSGLASAALANPSSCISCYNQYLPIRKSSYKYY